MPTTIEKPPLEKLIPKRRIIRADDGVRTRDLNLGKVPRYQLRYVRISCGGKSSAAWP